MNTSQQYNSYQFLNKTFCWYKYFKIKRLHLVKYNVRYHNQGHTLEFARGGAQFCSFQEGGGRRSPHISPPCVRLWSHKTWELRDDLQRLLSSWCFSSEHCIKSRQLPKIVTRACRAELQERERLIYISGLRKVKTRSGPSVTARTG